MVSNMTWGIWWILTYPPKSPAISLQWTIFVQSIWGLSWKKYRGVIFRGTKQWFKIWINSDLVVSKMAWGIGWMSIRASKNLKIVHWWALFVQSMSVSIRKFETNYVSWHKGCCTTQGGWLISYKQLKVQKNALWLDPFVRTIPIFRWKSTEALCLMTLKSDTKFEKLTLGLKNDMRNLRKFNASRGKFGILHFDVLL